jgi:hypothetical protein
LDDPSILEWKYHHDVACVTEGVQVAEQPIYTVTTRRLEGGPVGRALAAPSERAEAVADALLASMDGGDGWTWRNDEHRWWYPSRLAVRLTCVDGGEAPAFVRADVHVVTGGSATPQLLGWLNDLNAHAAGWWWWATQDGIDVYCSIKCLAEPANWWWPLVLFDGLPNAVTVAESMADELARSALGTVRVHEHPERGIRQSVDGWIPGCRLGPRDPSASLDLWFFEAERERMDKALGVICGSLPHELVRPLGALVADDGGEPRVMLRRHWHPQQGWGWQLAAVTGLATSSPEGVTGLRRVAARLNTEQSLEDAPVNRFGGWAYVEGAGLVHLTFVPAFSIDKILFISGSSVGDVAAMMLDTWVRFDDIGRAFDQPRPADAEREHVTAGIVDALGEVGWRCGPLGWSYVDYDGVPSTEPVEGEDPLWTDTAPLPYWTVPRHQIVCSFGTFNPAGPTVSSLEVAISRTRDGETAYDLYYVMRHPHSPDIRWLGAASSRDELARLVSDSLAETGPDEGICGAVEWLDIFDMSDAVLDGVRRFADSQDDTELRETAYLLLSCPTNPWERMGPGTSGGEPTGETPSGEPDPVELWLEAVTDPAVIAGCQLYLRSAWEGSKEFRSGDFEAAQQAANHSQSACRERVDAEIEYYRSLDGNRADDA